MPTDRACATSSKTPRSWAAYPCTVDTRFGIRSYRRFSSVSMSDHAFWTALRWETNRLYEATTPSAMTTMMTRTMIRGITDVSSGAGNRIRALGYRAASAGQTPLANQAQLLQASVKRHWGDRAPLRARAPARECAA